MLAYRLKTFYSYALIIFVLLSLFFANVHKGISIINVYPVSASSELSFAGITNPINFFSIVSPIQGTVTKVEKKYGDFVKQGQPLYTIKSTQMESTFRSSIETYIKAKSTYQNAVLQYNGYKELFRLGLVSKIDYLSKQDQLKDSELALWDAELSLMKTLKETGVTLSVPLENVSMEKIEEVRKILKQPLAGIRLTASKDGVLLFPSKALGGKSSEREGGEKITTGSFVQEGQVLAVIADTSGLAFDINVNESNFHDIKLGQKASITGRAFGGIQLTGKVISINHQASSGDPNDIPTYQVRVIVPHLTEKERSIIQVGMSADISLVKKNPPYIKIPITALIFKNNQYWVKTIVPKTNIVKEVPVTTGETDLNSIQIIKGLSSGDQIVVTD